MKYGYGELLDETDSGKPKYSEKNLSHCHFLHDKSHMDWPGVEPGPSLFGWHS
jgi:hypothetical protein